jgi:hypothetical protein
MADSWPINRAQEITMNIRDQLEGVARSVPIWLVVAGGVGGAIIALGNLVSLSQAISAGRTGFDLLWPLLALAFGVGLAAYFGYLGALKARLKRERR